MRERSPAQSDAPLSPPAILLNERYVNLVHRGGDFGSELDAFQEISVHRQPL